MFAVKWYSTYRHRVRIINLLLLCCTPMVYLIVFFLYHVNTCYSCYLLPFIILPRLCIASHTHDLMKMTSFTFNRHKVSQSILTLNTWFYFFSIMTSDKGHCYSQLEFQYKFNNFSSRFVIEKINFEYFTLVTICNKLTLLKNLESLCCA